MTQAKLIDISGASAAPLDLWEPVIVTREEIAREAERLADLPRPANGRRESLFVHPRATAPGLGFAPGIRVTLSVLKPGERSEQVARLQRTLASYGYAIEETGSYDDATGIVVTAFQRHFRPARVDGIADASTLLTLRALIETRPGPLA